MKVNIKSIGKTKEQYILRKRNNGKKFILFSSFSTLFGLS
jgi:hypothetical protein